MTDFKVGDTVKALHDSGSGIRKGHLYVVEHSDGHWIRFLDTNGIWNGWGAKNFELVETPQDTVVVTEDEFVAAVAAIDTATETVVAYLDSLNKRLEPYGVSLMLNPHD